MAVGVLAYYVGIRLIYGDRLPESALLIVGVWLAAAALAGPLFGAAGALWAAGSDRWRVAGISILAAGLLAEAAYRFIQLEAWECSRSCSAGPCEVRRDGVTVANVT